MEMVGSFDGERDRQRERERGEREREERERVPEALLRESGDRYDTFERKKEETRESYSLGLREKNGSCERRFFESEKRLRETEIENARLI
ncbi:Rna-Binding Protein 10 [Manis pentadactyla]|nr:Rna-Binding Protein 10 [Manis pentadactyla]